ncbi:MAG: hypothetical protein AB7G75_35210 [Candidatus Binatia bacterium]
MAKLKWKKQSLKLKDDHGWRTKPDHRIFVAGRGAVRFDIPQDWIFEPGPDSFQFHDRKPPHDDCRLEMSYLHLSPAIDWSKLPLSQLLEQTVKDDPRKPYSQSEIHTVQRPDLEYAWVELYFIDPAEKRGGISRFCFARGANIQPCITMEFWPEHAEKFTPVWDEVLRSLQLGVYVEDPTRGLKLH